MERMESFPSIVAHFCATIDGNIDGKVIKTLPSISRISNNENNITNENNISNNENNISNNGVC